MIAIITLIIVAIASLISIIIGSNSREESIEKSLNIYKGSNLKIIHQEPTNKGSIVFSIRTNKSDEYLSTAFISKNLFGYKELYSGSSLISDFAERELTAQCFPAVKPISLPIYFGVILNNEIEVVRVKQRNSSEVKEAKIIEADNKRLWLVYMNGFKGDEFQVVGYDSNDKSIYQLDDTIPWNVEQKPIKS